MLVFLILSEIMIFEYSIIFHFMLLVGWKHLAIVYKSIVFLHHSYIYVSRYIRKQDSKKYRLRQTTSHPSLLVARQGDLVFGGGRYRQKKCSVR